MIDIEDQKYLNILVEKIKVGKTVLFLGAGASISAGAPSTSELTKLIQEQFPNAPKSANFDEICENVTYTTGYGRPELYNFVQNQLNKFDPTNSHIILTHYDWGAIFTTNYDDIIEKAYLKGEALKSLKTITSKSDHYNILDRSICHLFKLNGCVRQDHEMKGRMKLTKTELIGVIEEKNDHFNLLLDVIKDGTILFIGYSFRDLLYLNIIQKACDRFGSQNLSYSYALFPNPDDLNEVEKQKLVEYRIVPLKLKFDEFFEFLNSKFDHRNFDYDYLKDHTIKAMDTEIIIPSKEANTYLTQFDFISEEKLSDDPHNKEDFFKGRESGWGPYSKHWDFERFFYSNIRHFNLKKVIIDRLKSQDIENFSKILLITGIPGIGKTTMAKRLGFDTYKEGFPVIFLENNPRNFDYISIQKFVQFIIENHRILNNFNFENEIPILLIVDNFRDWYRQIITLKNLLINDGYKALFVSFERIGIWRNESKKSRKDLDLDVIEISAISKTFESNEKEELITFLRNLEILSNSDTTIDDLEDESFFGAMYSLIDPAKEKFDQIIRNQFINLSDKASLVFKIICFIHQFNISINHEFLARITDIPVFSDLFDNIITGEASGIIHYEQDNSGNYFYRTNHKIIAQKTIEFFFFDPETKTEIFQQIFSKPLSSDSGMKEEEKICETILIDYISKNRGENSSEFTNNQIDRMFESLSTRIQSSSLFHHWGLIKKDLKQFDASNQIFKEALDLIEEDKNRGKKSEPISYIYTSWGTLFAEMGYEESNRGFDSKAEFYFKQAEARFEKAKATSMTDAVTYHAEAYMNLRRAKLAKNYDEKLLFYKLSMELIDKAVVNTDPSELPLFEKLKLELETILEQIDLDKTENLAESIYHKSNNTEGYYILIRSLIRRAEKLTNVDDALSLIKRARSILEYILNLEPKDGSLLKLRIKLLRQYYQEELLDLSKYLELLRDYATIEKVPQIDYLFEYACLSFKLGYYQDSDQIFKRIRKIISSLQLRFRIKLRDHDDETYIGQVVDIKNSRNGYIQSTDPFIKIWLLFKPNETKHYLRVGDLISFEIQFSISGPMCVNIKKR